MAELVPLKAVYDGSSICGLSELRDGDVVGVEHGGLGVCTIPSNTLLIGNGQGAISTTSALTTNGQIIIGGTGGPQIANLTGTSNEVEITDGNGAITIGLPATVQIATNLKTPAFSITNEYCLPTSDGSAGQIMCTNGSGALAFVDFDGTGHCIAFSGTTVADRTCLNFLGGGVTVSDNSGTNATDITIPVTTPELKVRNTSGSELSIQLDNAAIGGELICDTTPQLGGTLDVNGYAISSVSNCNISISPNGTGSVILDGLSWPQADGTAGYILCTNGSGSLSWAADAAGGSAAGSNNELQYNSSGSFGASSNLTFDGSTLAVTGGMTLSSTSTISGDMTFVDNAKVTLGTGGDADLYYDGTDVVLDPSVVGTGNFVVQVASSGADPNIKGLMVESSSSTAITIGSGTTAEGMLHFADSGAPNSGRIVYAHNENDMYFATAATERMRIDSAGHVGIGNTAPSSYMNSVHGLIIGNTGDATSEIAIATNTTGTAEINFTDTADTTNQAQISYNHGNANLDFKTTQSGGLFKFSPDTGGSVLLQVGDAWSNARVGIGTAAPASLLHVYAGASELDIQSTTSAEAARIRYRNTQGDYRVGVGARTGGGNFEIKSTSCTSTLGITMTQDGLVGIGCDAPTHSLMASGCIMANNGYMVGFNVTNPKRICDGGDRCLFFTNDMCYNCALWGHNMRWSIAHCGSERWNMWTSGSSCCYRHWGVEVSNGGGLNGSLTLSNSPTCSSCTIVKSSCILCAGTDVVAPTKSFLINHPCCDADTPNKFNSMLLKHVTSEGPEYNVFYRGSGTLCNGVAIVELPEYFESLTHDDDRTVQLTTVGGWSPLTVKTHVEDGQFEVCTTAEGDLAQEFDWRVDARRFDGWVREEALDQGIVNDDGDLIDEYWKPESVINATPEEPDNLDVLDEDDIKQMLNHQDIDVDDTDTKEDLLVKLREPWETRMERGAVRAGDEDPPEHRTAKAINVDKSKPNPGKKKNRRQRELGGD